jgi:hypothetical protein
MTTSTTGPVALRAPAYLIRDAALSDARHGRAACAGEVDSLLSQYDAACGYVSQFGHVIETMELRSPHDRVVTYQVVPLRVWEETETCRNTVPWSIVEWLDKLSTSINTQLWSLPPGLYLNGGRRSQLRRSHEVLAFYCFDMGREQAAREWLLQTFEPHLWPRMADLMRRGIQRLAAVQGGAPSSLLAAVPAPRNAALELRLAG